MSSRPSRSTDCSTRQRVAAPPAFVRPERHGGSAGRGLRDCGEGHPLPLLDKLLPHKTALFTHLQARWTTLFDARYEVLLYDLTSTYFESSPRSPRRTSGSSATVGTSAPIACRWSCAGHHPGRLSARYESGREHGRQTTCGASSSGSNSSTGRPARIWLMDRGIPTERAGGDARQHPAGCPTWWARRRPAHAAGGPAHGPAVAAGPAGVDVKLLPHKGEVYVLAQSHARVHKERAMRRRQLKDCGSGCTSCSRCP